MAPRKNKKNFRRKRRAKPKNQIMRIPQYRNLAPNTCLLRDTFQTQLKLSPTANVAGASHYPHVCFFDASSGHNVYNPINSGRETWNQLSGTLVDLKSLSGVHPSAYRRGYSHYYVLGSKMTVSFQPTANAASAAVENNIQVSCGLARDMSFPSAGVASGSTLTAISEARNCSTRQILCNTNNSGSRYSKVRMFSSYSPKSILGIKDTTDNEDLKTSVIDGKSPEQTFFFICLQGLNGALATDPAQQIPMLINVKIDYMLKFVEPVDEHNEPINNL